MKGLLIKVFLITLSTVLLSACFGPVKTPAVKHFALTNPGVAQQARIGRGPVLMVAVPAASPGYDNEDMIYVKIPHQLDHYAKHAWIAPPKDMLGSLLVKSLQNSGCFKAVVPSSFASTPNLTLNSQLFVLQQEFSSADPDSKNLSSQVRMIFDITLSDCVTNAPIAHRSFQCVIPAAPDAYGEAVAANTATADIMRQISAYLCQRT